MNLRQELRKRQGGMSDTDFAAKLEIVRPHYWLYMHEKHGLMPSQAKAVARVYPELRGLVCAEILGFPAENCDKCYPQVEVEAEAAAVS